MMQTSQIVKTCMMAVAGIAMSLAVPGCGPKKPGTWNPAPEQLAQAETWAKFYLYTNYSSSPKSEDFQAASKKDIATAVVRVPTIFDVFDTPVDKLKPYHLGFTKDKQKFIQFWFSLPEDSKAKASLGQPISVVIAVAADGKMSFNLAMSM